MTDEEKKIVNFWKDKKAIDLELLMNDLPTFISIIEKQQKEIEKLKNKTIFVKLNEEGNIVDIEDTYYEDYKLKRTKLENYCISRKELRDWWDSYKQKPITYHTAMQMFREFEKFIKGD